MKRRQALAALGTTGIASFAGCATASALVRTGPADFDEVSLSGPTTVAVDEEFSLTVEATNTGGTKGDFDAAVHVVQGPLSASEQVSVVDVPVTKTRSATVGPFRAPHAAELTFALDGTDVTHPVTVASKHLLPGEAYNAHGGDLIVQVDDVSFESALFYGRDSRNLLEMGADSLFVRATVTVQNATGEPIEFGPSSLTVGKTPGLDRIEGGTLFSPGLESVDLDGDPLVHQRIPSGGSRTGWVLIPVLSSIAAEGISVAWDHGWDDAPEAVWQPADLASPSFEITTTFPESVEFGVEGEFSVEIQNVGRGPGTFRGLVECRDGDGYEWNVHSVVEQTVDAGASVVWTGTLQEPQIGPFEYRLRPTGGVTTVEFVAATRSFGESFTSPAGFDYVLRFGGTAPSYTSVNDSWGESDPTTVDAAAGMEFAFVEVTATATERYVSFPDTDNFEASAGGLGGIDAVDWRFSTDGLSSPVTGDRYDGGWADAAGVTASGWLVFEVPTGTSASYLAVTLERWLDYDDSVDIAATWSG